MYEYCEIQNKWSWSIQIETVVRALHFERCNPDNVHENSSAFTSNVVNQVFKDRESRN